MTLRRSAIGWCDYSGSDLNFIIGCTPKSEGCANCYGFRWAKRAGRDFTEIRTYPQKLGRLRRAKWSPNGRPYRRGPGSKPIMFPVDMGDLFHPDVSREMITWFLEVALARDDADWVLLTKRPERMLDVTNCWLGAQDLRVLPSNIWCLVTAENQQRADERIPVLLQVRAQVRGVSLEPMLESVSLRRDPGRYWTQPSLWGMLDKLDWVIVGAESGTDRRPFEAAWAERVYEECKAAGVAFFGKQNSGLRPGVPLVLPRYGEVKEWPR